MFAVVQEIDQKYRVIGDHMLHESYDDAMKEWLPLALKFFQDENAPISYHPKVMDLSSGIILHPLYCDVPTIRQNVQAVHQEYVNNKMQLESRIKNIEFDYAIRLQKALM